MHILTEGHAAGASHNGDYYNPQYIPMVGYIENTKGEYQNQSRLSQHGEKLCYNVSTHYFKCRYTFKKNFNN
jgi:hypothetical protein